jgi:hypothetical protein
MRRIGQAFSELRDLNLELAQLSEQGVDINDVNLLEGLLEDPLRLLEHINKANPEFQHAFEEGVESPISPSEEKKQPSPKARRRL